jgi:Transposase DDE domain
MRAASLRIMLRCQHSGHVGNNVQSVVDAETHLIVTHEVTNQGHDRDQLTAVATQAKAVLKREDLHIIADKGYFSSREILNCYKTGIAATVPRPDSSGSRSEGRYVKANFAHEAEASIYRCPAGRVLTFRYTTEEDGLQLRRSWTTACQGCKIKSRCTTGRERRITRWEHEHLIEEANARRRSSSAPMMVRRSTVEHPFGTLKAWMGPSPFLTRRLRGVRTESALNALAYNIKRMISLITINGLMRAIPG